MIDPSTLLSFNPNSPTGQMLATDGSYVSLALIFVAFGLIAALSMRSRTISSFQFELYVFILVVVLAELPAILISLGFLQALAQYELLGLIVHSFSMAFVSGFILWRAAKAFAPSTKPTTKAASPKKEMEEAPKPKSTSSSQ